MFVIRVKSLTAYALIVVCVLSAAYFLIVSAEDDTDGIRVPVLMYHSICSDRGTDGKFVIKQSAFEEDLKYLRDNGYTAIGFSELIAFAEEGTPLPPKPVMLTFDDGYFNNYCYAYPLLKEYNQKAVISIIGKYTDLYSETTEENPNYSHITWKQAREMCDSGLVEIQNHSYNSHTTDNGRNGTKKKKSETLEAYAEYIMADVGKLQEEIEANLGYTPVAFAYPFGSISEASYDILKEMGFKATLGCEEKVNIIGTGDSLYMLGRYLRTSEKSACDILGKVMK